MLRTSGSSPVREVLVELMAHWRSGQAVGIGTVVGTWRSAPRPPGASMLVGPDGAVVGSVSGGCVESDVYALAQRVVDDGAPGAAAVRGSATTTRPRSAWSAAASSTCSWRSCPPRRSRSWATSPTTSRPSRSGGRWRRWSSIPIRTGSVAGWSCVRRGRAVSLGTLGSPACRRRRHRRRPGPAGRRADASCCTYGPEGQRRGRGHARSSWPALRLGPACSCSARSTSPPRWHGSGSFLGYRVTVCDARPIFATAARFPAADEVVIDWPHRYLEARGGGREQSTPGPRSACSPTTRSSTCRCWRWRSGCRRSAMSERWDRAGPTTTGWRGCGRQG